MSILELQSIPCFLSDALIKLKTHSFCFASGMHRNYYHVRHVQRRDKKTPSVIIKVKVDDVFCRNVTRPSRSLKRTVISV